MDGVPASVDKQIDRGDAAEAQPALDQLRNLLARAHSLLEDLESPAEVAPAEELERRLQATESDRDALMEQLVQTEHQVGKLMNLYVASYQLHAELAPTEVQNAIAEIARDLLGARSYVLLMKDEEKDDCDVALAVELDEKTTPLYGAGRYGGGVAAIDTALEDGVLYLAESREDITVVPLRVDRSIVGALVILRLFDHKSTPISEDREILDLLAAHAATALFSARVFSEADRKLKTLEGLMKLVQGR